MPFLQLSPGQGKFGHPLPGHDSSMGANQCKKGPSRQGGNDRAFAPSAQLPRRICHCISTGPRVLQTPLPTLRGRCGEHPPSRKINARSPPA